MTRGKGGCIWGKSGRGAGGEPQALNFQSICVLEQPGARPSRSPGMRRSEEAQPRPSPGQPPFGARFQFFHLHLFFLFLINVREECVFSSPDAPGPGRAWKASHAFPGPPRPSGSHLSSTPAPAEAEEPLNLMKPHLSPRTACTCSSPWVLCNKVSD